MDTRAKRLSALRACCGLSAGVIPDPDTVIDQGDRATMCWTYRALTSAGAVVVTGGAGDFLIYLRRRRRRPQGWR